jgi:hypothetical protein
MTREFVAKDYQEKLIGHMLSTPRQNAFASPGMGKTVSALTALQIMSMVDDVFPALAIGPMRVANSVWHREVDKWAHLKGLRVSRVLGTLDERIAALKSPADIYTTHYGLLNWLHQYLGGRWPFKWVLADESTRLKNNRCSFRKHHKSGKVSLYTGGGVNASAIARYAPRTPYWTNLSGTPAPNGLKDLWGQHWYVDFGSALGNSYDAFSRRWFYQRRGTQREQAVFDPMPHAFDEITERMRPTTIMLDAYDYFDCERPREVDIEIELPDPVMKQYRKMHREAFLKLREEKVITAVNAGVAASKCMQIASGHVFDEQGTPHLIHTEKLDALESLMENLQGAPLLVAYHFQPDLQAILKRFPFAVALPSGARQQQVEDDWNAGKIPMLLVHPASAGHGLNLQYGGCDLCIYTPYWDLELYLQVVERIGPVRQMQAGFKRLTNVYRLVAKGTIDEKMVNEILPGKIKVQDAFNEEMAA